MVNTEHIKDNEIYTFDSCRGYKLVSNLQSAIGSLKSSNFNKIIFGLPDLRQVV